MDLSQGDNHVEFKNVVSDNIDSLYFYGDDIFATQAGSLVRKGIGSLEQGGGWGKATKKKITSVAIFGDDIYAVDDNHNVVKQSYFKMTQESPWTKASRGGVSSITLEVLLS